MMLSDAVSRYCLLHCLGSSTEDQYHRIASVYAKWAAGRELTADNLSEFLRSKERAGCSSWYVRSLRAHLLAVLRFCGDAGPVRPVRCRPLPADDWTADEVRQLVAACGILPDKHRRYWETLIQAAWWTGLSASDLHRVKREEVGDDGTLATARHKTGAAVLVWMPLHLISHVESGLIWPLRWSREWERRVFRRICAAAGLKGTLKKLRRSSGVSVEISHPGHGHEHLGNSRPVFERHYLRQKIARCWKPQPI